MHVTISVVAFTTAWASYWVAADPLWLAIKNSAVYPVRSKADPLEFFGRITNSLVSPRYKLKLKFPGKLILCSFVQIYYSTIKAIYIFFRRPYKKITRSTKKAPNTFPTRICCWTARVVVVYIKTSFE